VKESWGESERWRERDRRRECDTRRKCQYLIFTMVKDKTKYDIVSYLKFKILVIIFLRKYINFFSWKMLATSEEEVGKRWLLRLQP